MAIRRTVIGGGVLGIAVAALALAAWITGAFGLLFEDDPPRIVVSPYVTIQDRMMATDGEVLFTVAADSPSYWRLASLDVYDGHIWKLYGEYNPGLPELDIDPLNDDETVTIHQEFQIIALGEIWLPTAPEPAAVTATDDADFEITAERVSRNMTVANARQDSDGLRYSVVSRVATPAPDRLRAAPPVDVASVRNEYLSTFGFPAVAGELAAELTVGMSTDYDKLIAIRDHLRSFTHLDGAGPLQAGANGASIEQFLQARRGAALDFASTFALMAREVGVPSRLAVGFTAGNSVRQDQATGLTTFEVTDRHAHAWPEVYFEGIGWIAFEPTPGFGS